MLSRDGPENVYENYQRIYTNATKAFLMSATTKHQLKNYYYLNVICITATLLMENVFSAPMRYPNYFS
jgi:hypothetical protein